MRNLLFLSVLSTLPLAACGDGSSGYPEVDDSLAAWEDVRDSATLGYDYVRYVEAFDDAPRQETRISVDADGEVYKRFWRSLDESGEVIEFWEEEGDELGTNSGAFPAVTLDALYDECVAIFDTGRDAIVFDTFADGVMKDCFYGDDGVIGVRLLEIVIEEEGCVAGVVGRPCGLK